MQTTVFWPFSDFTFLLSLHLAIQKVTFIFVPVPDHNAVILVVRYIWFIFIYYYSGADPISFITLYIPENQWLISIRKVWEFASTIYTVYTLLSFTSYYFFEFKIKWVYLCWADYISCVQLTQQLFVVTDNNVIILLVQNKVRIELFYRLTLI